MALKMSNRGSNPYKWSQHPAHNWGPLCANYLVHSFLSQKKQRCWMYGIDTTHIWTALSLSVINVTASISIPPPKQQTTVKTWDNFHWTPQKIIMMAGQPTPCPNLTQKLQVFPPVTNGIAILTVTIDFTLRRFQVKQLLFFQWEYMYLICIYKHMYVYIYMYIHLYIHMFASYMNMFGDWLR